MYWKQLKIISGENTVTEAKNFVNDCNIINSDNYYFIINGINVSDNAVTKFEDDSKYIKYNFFKFRSYKEHYKKYLGWLSINLKTAQCC